MGERVGVTWVRDICGKCQYCRVPGGETRCIEQWNSGRKRDGTFAEYCVVPSRYILTLPDELTISDEFVAPILCGGVTGYKALKVCNAIPGDWVTILGAGGGVGALSIQYAKAMGFRVIAIDVGLEKKDFCLGLGAEIYLEANADVENLVKQATQGIGTKSVIVAASSGVAYEAAFDLVSGFGTVVCVGIPPPSQKMSLHPLQFIDKGINLVGVLVGTHKDTLEALDFVQRGVVKPSVHMTTMEELSDTMNFLNKVHHPTFITQWTRLTQTQTNGKYVIKY